MKHNRKIIYLAGFLFSIPIALTSYINSSFLKDFITEYYIGILYVVASLITILGMLEMPKMLTHIGNRKTTLIFSIVCFLSLLLLAFGSKSFIVVPGFILFFITSNLLIATLDIFIEDFSKNSSTGKLRGIYLTIINLAWVIAQSISGSILTKSSYSGLYLFSALFMLLVSIIFVMKLHNFIDPKYTKIPVIKTVKSFIKNRNISKIYILNFILKFFFVWMIIYTPIYLHEYLGFGWEKIGLIFTFMLLPFVILTYPLGKLSDKIGEKKMLLFGFGIASFFTLLIPFIKVPNFWIWAGILFATRVGAATIEIMSESYFFKSVDKEDANIISFFRNTAPLSFIIAPLLATLIFLLTKNFSYIFFILGAILLCGLFVTLQLRDVK
ncbi:MAG: hypothetical protein UU24_C0021G0004 [Candidatus Nomurabacteria bacterium GW2011_GWA2_40_9]|uniref:Major facilitator superfamily (MFS) profile domain-containing protein n=1 Tax=Candidatus Nomurabacteria bacterium GW2011_GWA2_40_9 TaxID=1618734 RepID=A0A0G0W3Y1_9BACT|nr:MAG: hypothetical protein UU24_C0021G0004 [Candidatus Nomurabacteria bacterium GW2011_GWA2_40_9]